MPGEELLLEGQHEDPPQPQLAGPRQQRRDDRVPDALPDRARVDRHRADLAEVLPEHVQRAAADDLAVELADQELLDRLVEGDDLLGQQHAARVGVDQRLDRGHVGRPCRPHVPPPTVTSVVPWPR